MATGLSALSKGFPRCWLDIKILDQPVGRIVVELRQDVCGKTAESFRALCVGDKGIGKSGKRLWLKGSAFHRIVPNSHCQCGDFTRKDGTGGESAYGGSFEDESFILRHTGRGVVSMANCGPDTNGSQFFITFSKAEWLDGSHVVFGYIVEGLDVLAKIEACGTDHGAPTKSVSIADCGQVQGYG